jgi:hypothetical protein
MVVLRTTKNISIGLLPLTDIFSINIGLCSRVLSNIIYLIIKTQFVGKFHELNLTKAKLRNGKK